MKNASKRCPDCGTEMDEGFVPEYGTLGLAPPQFWHPGKPKKKYDSVEVDSAKTIEISVFRCSNCGLLKRYALETSES
jgi:predicted RNA-binding Zn-ribbon protein involved in translation (DUF1610 family)